MPICCSFQCHYYKEHKNIFFLYFVCISVKNRCLWTLIYLTAMFSAKITGLHSGVSRFAKWFFLRNWFGHINVIFLPVISLKHILWESVLYKNIMLLRNKNGISTDVCFLNDKMIKFPKKRCLFYSFLKYFLFLILNLHFSLMLSLYFWVCELYYVVTDKGLSLRRINSNY